MRCINISQINKSIQSDVMEFIKKSNEEYTAKIAAAAKSVAESHKPIVLLSGPSGSGKTTTALRLAEELKKIGLSVPSITDVCNRLRSAGMPLPEGIYTVHMAKAEIEKILNR